MKKREGCKIGGIILARLDSSRLPGKQIKKVHGRLVMDWMLERVAQVEGLDQVVLATSDRPLDDPLETLAHERGLSCFRGSAEDVAGRVLGCAQNYEFDAWVRINGDSPLLDYRLFTRGISLFRNDESLDAVTNVIRKTYPIGNSVEVFDTKAFAQGYSKMDEKRHFEHVTLYFYEHADDFHILNFVREAGSIRLVSLALDTPEDLARYSWMLEKVSYNHLDLIGSKAVALALEYVKSKTEAVQ